MLEDASAKLESLLRYMRLYREHVGTVERPLEIRQADKIVNARKQIKFRERKKQQR